MVQSMGEMIGEVVSDLKEAALTTVSDTYELAAMRLGDIVADLGDDVVAEIDRVVAFAIDQVEIRADEATKGLAKEEMFLGIALPAVNELLDRRLNGIGGSIARRTIRPLIEDGLRGMARVGVRLRNGAFHRPWKSFIIPQIHRFEAWLERTLGIDIDRDGGVGTIGGVTP